MFQNINDLEYNTYKPVDYVVCKNCGLISQSPVPHMDLLPGFYPDEYRNYLPVNGGVFSLLKKLQFYNLAGKIIKSLNKKAKILEIGFGNGQLLLALKQKGFENLYGTDFTNKSFSSLNNLGIKLAVSNTEENFPFGEKFDAIIMNNVIEHFTNPIKVLKNCQSNLAKNGRIALITPNSNALEFSIFKRYWAGFHAPRHVFIFNDNNMKLLSKKLGFSSVGLEPMIDPGQWIISVQNILQSFNFTKTKLKNGMTWYCLPLSLYFTPIAALQNLIGRSTSMLCILKREE